MKWLRKILGLDKQQESLNEVQSSLGNSIELLQKSLEELKSVKDVSNKNEESLKEIETNLETSFNKNYYTTTEKIKGQLLEVQKKLNSEIESKIVDVEKSISRKLENQHLKEFEEIEKKTNVELNSIKKEVDQVLEILLPKHVPIDFKLVDSLDNNIELFSFQKLTESNPVQNQIKVKNENSILRNLIGSIPELTSTSLLANSYRFAYPKGITGQVMQIGSGQGTAIMQNGSIAAHGTYNPNALIAAPLAIYSIGSMLIKQHYLNKIHKKLELIESQLKLLIDFIKIEKQSKVRAIAYFFGKALNEFDHVNSNLSYRNAMLTNIIAKNIEVYELIQFYSNSITNVRKSSKNSDELEEYLKSFLDLQELFLYGKMLAFMYSNLFDREIQNDFIKEFKLISSYYVEVLTENSNLIQSEFDKSQQSWSDWFKGQHKTKKDNRNLAIQDHLTIESLKRDVVNKLEQGENLITDVINQIEKPQEFIIEKGELYQLN